MGDKNAMDEFFANFSKAKSSTRKYKSITAGRKSFATIPIVQQPAVTERPKNMDKPLRLMAMRPLKKSEQRKEKSPPAPAPPPPEPKPPPEPEKPKIVYVKAPTPPPRPPSPPIDWGEKPRRSDTLNYCQRCEVEEKKEIERNFYSWVHNGQDNDMPDGKVILFPRVYRPELDDPPPIRPVRSHSHSRSSGDIKRPVSARSSHRALENRRSASASEKRSRPKPKVDDGINMTESVDSVLVEARKMKEKQDKQLRKK